MIVNLSTLADAAASKEEEEGGRRYASRFFL
jgi:hypothetical protein